MNIPQIIDKLAQKYKYKPLPEDIAHKYRQLWREHMPAGLTEAGDTHCAIYSRTGTMLATGYTRVVIGDYGAYIEISPDCLISDNIEVKHGQEKRIGDPQYKYAKYHWYQPISDPTCKLYHQQRPVSYADYMPGMWYVSPFDVMLAGTDESEDL